MLTEGKVDAEKELLRSRFIRLQETVPQTDRQKKSVLISSHLAQFTGGQSPITIELYAAFRGEADLSSCLKRLQTQRHNIVYPKTDKQTKRLSFYLVRRLEDLVIGNYGILEPVPKEENFVPEENIDILCVPGLAFTRSGIRLGYGGGFYDRLFANTQVRSKRIGIAYGIQIAESLPESLHDAKMDYLLTEEGWTACER